MIVFAMSCAAAVPDPFLPVAVHESDDAITIDVWGRSYRFASGPFPTAIRSQDVDLLLDPVAIRVRLGDADARSLRFDRPRTVARTRGSVTLKSRSELDAAHVEATTRIEYDGMIHVRIDFSSDAPVALREFTYSFALPSAATEWFNRHLPYDYAAQNVDKQALLETAGRLPDGERRFDYAPTLFLGGRTVGLELWWESNVEWSRDPARPPMRIDRDATTTRLTVSPVTPGSPYDVATPWAHEVALFPTPLRAPPPRWRSNRFVSYKAVGLLTRREDLRYYWIAFPSHFDAIHHGLPRSTRSPRQERLRDELERLDVGYIPYAKLTAAPSGHPKTVENVDVWAANETVLSAPLPDERALLEAHTDWSPGQVYGYPICTDRADYLDWIRAEVESARRIERLDGLYFDFGSITRMCERAVAAREGPDEAGRSRPEAWFYLNLRSFYKQLYESMHADAHPGLLTLHTHGQPRALAAWADYTFVGEALNVVFRGDASLADVQRNPGLYVPDYLALPDGWMDAMTFPIAGGIVAWLPQLKQARDPRDRGRVSRFQRGFLAWVLVNDAHVWLGNGDFEEMAAVYRALDAFGSLDDAEVRPWWSVSAARSSDPGLAVTTYTRDDAVLVVVANLGARAVDAEIDLSAALLSGATPVRARDLEHAPPSRWLRVSDRRLAVSVPARSFRLLLARP